MRSGSGKLWVVAIAVVVLCALIGLVALTAWGNDGSRGEASSTTDPTSNPDEPFREQPADLDLSIVNEAKFVSVNIVRQHASKSYMLGAGDQEFSALTAAVAASIPVQATMTETGCSMTFVLSDRRTVSFSLDIDRWLLARGGRSLQPGPGFATAVSAIEERGK